MPILPVLWRGGRSPVKRTGDVNLPSEGGDWERYYRDINEPGRRRIEPPKSKPLWKQLSDAWMQSVTGVDPNVEYRESAPLWDKLQHVGMQASLNPVTVMDPVLRGNKALQSERLSKLSLPGVAGEVLSDYKARYPRFLSHFEKLALEPQEGALGSYNFNPYESHLPPLEREREFLFDPETVGQTKSKAAAANVLRHELSHGAQDFLTGKGTSKTGFLTFPESYETFSDLHGYTNNPYEIAANQGGLKGSIQQVLRDKWNQIKPSERNTFVRRMGYNTELQDRINRNIEQTGESAADWLNTDAESIINAVFNRWQSMDPGVRELFVRHNRERMSQARDAALGELGWEGRKAVRAGRHPREAGGYDAFEKWKNWVR